MVKKSRLTISTLGLALVCLITLQVNLNHQASATYLSREGLNGYSYVPTNFRNTPVWNDTLKQSDTTFYWDATPGAISYNIYRYDTKIATVQAPATSYLVPQSLSNNGETYAITAVNNLGAESIPSSIVNFSYTFDPNNLPSWAPSTIATATPNLSAYEVYADPEWNLGVPRIHLHWGTTDPASFNVYRDGAIIARMVNTPQYEDTAVEPGKTYSYQVTTVNGNSVQKIESEKTTPVEATAYTAAPSLSGNYGNGMLIEEYNDPILTNFVGYRSDHYIGSLNLPSETSIRWTGAIIPKYSETYTLDTPFHNCGGINGVQLWINGTMVIDDARHDGGQQDDPSATVQMQAGQRYEFKMEYNNHNEGCGAQVELDWASSSQPHQVIPAGSFRYPIVPVDRQKIQVTKVQENDDSVRVFFNQIPGISDYRVYKAATDTTNAKYLGTVTQYQGGDYRKNGNSSEPTTKELNVEFNGIATSGTTNLIVEGVDKLGPFQKMDGTSGPGAASGNVTNGQGDPSNVPNILASSDVFQVQPIARSLTGGQAFFDTFRDNHVWTSIPLTDPTLIAKNAAGHSVTEFKNDKWTIRSYEADDVNTKLFTMNNHFMDTAFDGPTDQHNNNASVVMIPNATADISGGKVLHATMEVDAHNDGRRWEDIFVGEAGDTLISPEPGKLDNEAHNSTSLPTVKGSLLDIDINGGDLQIGLSLPKPSGTPGVNYFSHVGIPVPNYGRGINGTRSTSPSSPNGTQMDIDNRSKFDVYLTTSHYKIVETEPDGTQVTNESDFPNGVTLPFTNAQVYYVHELYHTGNEFPESVGEGLNDAYWYMNRPFSDERHWDNMGFDVLNSLADIPSDSSLVLPFQIPTYVGLTTNIPPFTCASVDLDGDGKITLTDLILAIQAYNGHANAAAIALWPTSGNPGLQGLIKMIQAYNGKCT